MQNHTSTFIYLVFEKLAFCFTLRNNGPVGPVAPPLITWPM